MTTLQVFVGVVLEDHAAQFEHVRVGQIELERLVIGHEKSNVASPCVNICQMDEMTGLCRGCFRTLEEIAGWSRAADDEKLAILSAVNRRRIEHDPCGEDFRGDCGR